MTALLPATWFVIQVARKAEGKIAVMLRNKGYQEFYPTYKSRRKWSDRVKNIELPLFPGYIFVRLLDTANGLLLSTPGVIRIVTSCGKPCPISDEEIEAIRRITMVGQPLPTPYVNVGQRVVIQTGPCAGISGIVTKIRNQARLVISLEMIMRSISIEVDTADVRPVAVTGPILSMHK